MKTKRPNLQPNPDAPEALRAYAGTRKAAGRLQYADILFIGVLAALTVFLWRAAHYGVQTADEAFYYTIPHRILQGDRLLTDEWQLSQLSAVFQYLPFYLYHTVTGGTEGIVLYFRLLYVAVDLIFFSYIYFSLRRYGFWGLAAAVVFVGYSAFGHMALNYYTMSNMALLLSCFIMFGEGELTAPRVGFAGFVFACCVLIEPAAAVIWFAYTLTVLLNRILKKKKPLFGGYTFVLNGRVWLLFTVGVAACAVLFLADLIASTDMKALFANLPELAGDSEYDFVHADAKLFKWHKIYMYLLIYGFVPAGLNLAYGGALVVFRKRLAEKRLPLFAVGCVLYAVGVVFAALGPFREAGMRAMLARPVVLCLFGVICYVFTEKKNKKAFAALVISFLFAFLTDFTSEASVGVGCITGAVASVTLFAEALRELRAEREKEKRPALRRVCAVCTALALIALVAGESWNCVLTRVWHYVEDYTAERRMPLDAELTAGPLSGVRTTRAVKEKYDAALSDLDNIRSRTDGAFYVADLCPWYYLYAQLPYGTYSSYYVPDDSETRILRWWALHPDAVPEYVYVPFFNCDEYAENPDAAERTLRFLKTVCDYEKETGEAGYILRTFSWRLPAAANADASPG